MEKDDFKKLQKSVDLIAETTVKILETMATKDDIARLDKKIDGAESGLKSEIHDLRTDLKGFKEETRDSFVELNEKFDDLSDTVMNHDKRIEKLEGKVLKFSPVA